MPLINPGGMSIGELVESGTAGSVLFVGATGLLAEDNSNLFWDDSNNRLGIGTNAPPATLSLAAANGVDLLRTTSATQTVNLVRSSGLGMYLLSCSAGMRYTTGAEMDLFATGALNLRYGVASGFTLKDSNGDQSFGIESRSPVFSYQGQSSVDNITQDALRIRPSTTVGTFYRAWAHYLTSTDTAPATYLSKASDLIFGRTSTTTTGRLAASIVASLSDTTDASRKGRLVLSVADASATREGMRIDTDGSVAKIGLFGVTPVPRTSAYTVTNGTTDRSFDANATTIDELADVVATIIADMQALGPFG